jgi:hypothetical protein
MYELSVHLGQVQPESLWSTELLAALIGALVGGAASLVATILANRHSRKMADRARLEGEADRFRASEWRIYHSFRTVVGQIMTMHEGIFNQTRRSGSKPDWRTTPGAIQPAPEEVLNADDLRIFHKNKNIELMMRLMDLMEDLRAIRAALSRYTAMRVELIASHGSGSLQATDEELIKKDLRFDDLMGTLESLTQMLSEAEAKLSPLSSDMEAAFQPMLREMGVAV